MSEAVHILGAGSIGLLLAARLSTVAELRLLRRPGVWPASLRLELQEGEGLRTLSVPQSAPDRLAAPVRRLIVCTKAYDALPALEGLRSRLAPSASLLLMQNGMGSQRAIVEALPGCSIYAASSTEGAFRPAPGRVVHAGRGITRIGRLSGDTEDWVGLFQAAGLAAEAAESIEYQLADKLRVNALINPLTVLHDCNNGALLELPSALAAMRDLGVEADAVLAAAGFRFPGTAFERATAVAAATAGNVSSMLQDARGGRPLEIEYITGYLLRLAGQVGVPAPSHAVLYERLRQRLSALP